ncbi:hypothetical protein ES708_11821 [subsurface metagenome]
MRRVRITQKDGVTHTIFMVGGKGHTLPDGNYEIAKRWHEEGLLCESSAMAMEAIAEEKIRGRRLLGHGG